MPSTQSSLDQFFGGGKAGKPKKQQTTLNAFLLSKATNKKLDKENKNLDPNEDDDDDNDEKISHPKSTKNQEISVGDNVRAKRRRAIVDDEDEDEGDVVDQPKLEKQKTKGSVNDDSELDKLPDDEASNGNQVTAASLKTDNLTPQPSSNNARQDQLESKTKTESKSIMAKATTTTVAASIIATTTESGAKTAQRSPKKARTEPTISSLDEAIHPKRQTLIQAASKLAKELKVPSNDELLKSAGPKNTPVSYATLVKVLERIEQITGRLEIQSLLTTLFRQVLLTHPRDLYPMVYLCSNSVAPAYECVELGIGDSILIKAIGEAYGTNPGTFFF